MLQAYSIGVNVLLSLVCPISERGYAGRDSAVYRVGVTCTTPSRTSLPDIDPDETAEWIDSLDQMIERSPARAPLPPVQDLLHARSKQIGLPVDGVDRLHQHDPARAGAVLPGRRGPRAADPPDHPVERGGDGAREPTRITMGIGGHLSTYASSASLYEVGFNHFFRGKDAPGGGDQVFIQGHGAPGIYAARVPGGSPDRGATRELQAGGRRASASRPTRTRGLMPNFWEFPTVSMGSPR